MDARAAAPPLPGGRERGRPARGGGPTRDAVFGRALAWGCSRAGPGTAVYVPRNARLRRQHARALAIFFRTEAPETQVVIPVRLDPAAKSEPGPLTLALPAQVALLHAQASLHAPMY